MSRPRPVGITLYPLILGAIQRLPRVMSLRMILCRSPCSLKMKRRILLNDCFYQSVQNRTAPSNLFLRHQFHPENHRCPLGRARPIQRHQPAERHRHHNGQPCSAARSFPIPYNTGAWVFLTSSTTRTSIRTSTRGNRSYFVVHLDGTTNRTTMLLWPGLGNRSRRHCHAILLRHAQAPDRVRAQRNHHHQHSRPK